VTVERLAPKLARARMETRLPDGSMMRCDFSDIVQRQIYFGGLFEPIEAYLFLKMLGPGMTAFDVGANCGQYTLLAARAVGALGYRAFEVGQSPRHSRPISDFNGVKFANVIFHAKELPAEITSGWHRRPVKRWACSGW
jgi:hypothetical protein